MRKISLKGLFCPKSLESKQIILTMKITLFLLLFVTFQAYCENGYSQSAKISIPRSTLKVSELLTQIESQTDYLFVYNKKSVDTKRVVNVDATNQPVSEILDKAFEGTGIHYVVEGNNIVLTKNITEHASTQQQKQITVKGVVTDMRGEPIIGASVVEKGTTNGTITDLDGNFTLKVPSDAIINITYVGYQPQSLSVSGQTTFKIKMEEESMALEQVVVTAMGIKKKAASLTYSTQQLGGDELTRAKDPNMIAALAGKSAGVQISKSASGLGGSAKVSIRGIRSANEDGNNQPLYVIDGVPMLNSTTESVSTVMGGKNDGVNRDAGDGISNLNPDDIESMSILKGASAAALYGSQAANGVILITTKKGKAGVQRITYSSGLTVDHAISLPEFQNSYGAKAGSSWGEKENVKDYDNAGNWFSNGVTAINSVSVMTGNEKLQTYFSYANTTAKGIVDSNKLRKHNLTLRESASLFNDRLKLDANANLMVQTIKNSPTSGGIYLNPLVDVYGFPRGQDLSEYATNFEKFDENRNMPVQSWFTTPSEWTQNPYWVKNRILNNNKRYRALASLTANLKATDWLNLQARGNVDYVSDKFDQKMYASTSPAIVGNNGRYVYADTQNFLIYGDVMAMFNKHFGDFSVNAALGGSINVQTENSLTLDSKTASLYKPNLFTVPNIVMNTSASAEQVIDRRRTIQSVFATAQVGWKDALFLDLTARNDWSSTLSHTNSVDKGFFYPSVGLSWVINESFKLPQWISFGKIRGSWAQVGNDLPIGITDLSDIIGAGGKLQAVDVYNRGDLKPEISNSIEFGLEWRLFNSRVDFDFTYYKTDTKNQLLKVPTSAGEDYAYRYINAGKIRNKGFEITLGATPVLTEDFRWKTTFNYSQNRNKVVELAPNYTSFVYGDPGFSMAYMMQIKEGGSLGDIYGNTFARDEQGKIKVSDEGKPISESGNKTYLGNCNPDFLLSWANTFTYKVFSLYFLIDMRKGGDVMSLTQATLDGRGVTKATAEARDRGYVEVDGTRFENVEGFYSVVGDRNGISERYMYSATNIRLRELSLSYSFPSTLLAKTKVFTGIDVSLVGRNLFFFYKDAPFDPDAILSVGNTNQGVDVFGMPTTRNIGFNVKFTF